MKLKDLGERRIISEIISQYCDATIGDDCALLNIGSGTSSIVVTMDPVPPPAAEVLGGDSDPYWGGRLLVTINASDLAAAAAKPLAFFTGIEAPSDMDIDKFERFLLGIRDGCQIEGLRYSGGNIRESNSFRATGTAIGTKCGESTITRSGAKAGDGLALIGASGQFWLDALYISEGGKIANKELSPIYAPKSQSQQMRLLSNKGYVKCAMDNSDGLFPSAIQLGEASNLGVVIDFDLVQKPKGQDSKLHSVNVSYQRLVLGWGDWNVLIGYDRAQEDEIRKFCDTNEILFSPIGHFIPGRNLFVRSNNETIEAPRLDSERFSKDSWFSEGIDSYINLLKSVKLPNNL